MEERCTLCCTDKDSHYDGVQCPMFNGTYFATQKFTPMQAASQEKPLWFYGRATPPTRCPECGDWIAQQNGTHRDATRVCPFNREYVPPCRYCAWCEEPLLSHSRLRLMRHNLICWFTSLPTSHVQMLAERSAVERSAKDGAR